MKPLQSIGLAVGAVAAAGLLGARNGPQRPLTGLWYAVLRKPGFTPPGPVIGAAWSALELLLAATGYRLLRAADTPERSAALTAWVATLGGLAGYPLAFFGQKRLALSTGVSGAMLASATGLTLAARKVDRPSAAMTIPLMLWLAFATVLSEEIWRKNAALSRD
jgi:tryptophan-rich sensory protein